MEKWTVVSISGIYMALFSKLSLKIGSILPIASKTIAGKLGRLPTNGVDLGRFYDGNRVARDH